MWVSERPRVESFVRHSRLTRPLVDRFVAGQDGEDAIQAIKDLNSRGIGGILDLLGEGVADPAGAEEATTSYHRLIERIDETRIDTTVSIKLTHLGLAFDKETCLDHLRRLCTEAARVGTSVEVDMEQARFVDDTLGVFKALVPDFPDLRLALQAALRRTPVDLEQMAHLRPRIRLVKGAYAEPEEVALQRRQEVVHQYRFVADRLLELGTKPAFATHDHRLIEHVRRSVAARGMAASDYEFQMLYGIRRDLQESLVRAGVEVNVYVPFGEAWYPYLMRRIAERPANMWFFLRAVTGR